MGRPLTLSSAKQALLEQRLKRASYKDIRRPEIPRRSERDSAPLSFTQHQMWVIDQITPGNPAYNMPCGYRIKGAVNIEALEASFNEIIKRHEALRTTFAVNGGEPVQLIHAALRIKIDITKLDHLSGTEREERLQVLASEESVKPFDLSRLPLIRLSLFKLAVAEHVLLINVHHIIADGLSIGLLLNELDRFYSSFTLGGDPDLRVLPVQYGDFALWERQSVANEGAYSEQIEFWRRQLDGRLHALELPADKRRPVLQSFKGSNVFFDIPTALADGMKSLAEREGCTFFMIVLAVFQMLLHRYSGAEDIVIGTPVARRSLQEIEPVIGPIINMVALRCDLAGDPTFVELLQRIRATMLDVFSNSEVPFEVVLKKLKFERDPSRNPIFQVALQMSATTAPRLCDLDVSGFHFDSKFAQFDLTLHLYEGTCGYKGRFEYCTDLFNAETIARFSIHFGQLLQAVIRIPEQTISTLPILTDAERRQVVEIWNHTAVAYPAPRCLHEMVEEQARIRPDALAAEMGRRQLTYRELDQEAERLAGRLRSHGVRGGLLVAIFLDRSIETLIGLLAVWKAGGGYVPIDPEFPVERVRFILEDTRAVVVLTQKSISAALPPTSAIVLHLDVEQDRVVSSCDASAPYYSSSPEQLAYVIYTSGSTGRPKGVPITHANLFNLICWHQQAYAVTPSDRATQIAGPAFDASVWEIWPYLTAGASVYIADDSTRLDEGRLVKWLTNHQITLAFLPTPLAELILRENWPDTTALRVLLTGGDRLNTGPRRKLPFRLINHYGPTENTIVSTCAEVEQSDSNVAPPIGRPLPNTTAYILDRHLQPVPIGVPGELVLGGAQLSSGYWNRRELTAEKFIPNPFRAEAGTQLYRTGDLGRFLPDGNIEFLGRMDGQVKIRGFRIETGEIEFILSQHPSVREIVVLARQDVSEINRLVAYVVVKDSPVDLVGEFRTLLRASVPEYMVPTVFVFLDTLPLTPNGKIDRKALPLPDRNRFDLEKIVAPRDQTETILCDLWAEVLKIDRVGIDDNFFALGGHSLLAARLFARLDETFGRSLPLGILFATPTVRALAQRYRTDHEPISRSIVALKASGSLPPIYAVPGVFGNVLGFADLARELGPDQPFYALQSVGLDGKEAPLETIEEMAQLYIDEIRSVQRHGPYALLGACFGATVAYEIARQLLSNGEYVAVLALLDPTIREGGKKPPSAPRAVKRMAALGTLVSERLRLYLDEMNARPGRDRIKYLVQKIRSLARLFTDDYASKGAQRELHQIEVYRANLRAADQYRREPLSGPLASLEIFETERDYQINSFGRPIDWGDLWKGTPIKHRVAGKDSGDMLSGANARLLASLLAKRLRTIFSQVIG